MQCSDLMSHRDSIGALSVMDNIRKQIGVHFPAPIEAI